MKRALILASLATAMALPILTSPGAAQASCADRKLTGTVLGGVGGALIGNSIARGGAGAVLGGLGGAFIGHEVAGSGCRSARRAAYYGPARVAPTAAYDSPAPNLYYDRYGNAVYPTAPGAPGGPAPLAGQATPVAYAGAPACRTEIQSYTDSRGVVMRTPVKVCDR